MNTIRFGIVGCGLMGREFASAAARWCHLVNLPARPDIVAVCDQNPALFGWYAAQCPELKQQTTEYRELLANQDVDAVYAAVPHHLHEEIYTATIRAGKHLMGEKPFGIDLAAAEAIMAAADQRPGGLIRCSSESVFFPAMQRIGAMIEERRFGRILEVDTGFLHSSDLDPDKPLNWKRMVRYNGEYGVLGDLGMHACHLPLRAGWRPRNVRAILSDVVQERPDGKGGRARCDTWDNAVLLCETADPATGERFPWTMKTQRIAPGQRNHWYTRINGTRASARWSSVAPDVLEVLEYNGKEQVWGTIQTGHETAYKTITGDIFQFGFTDSILQMWAAFVQEISGGQALKKFAGCVTPAEALLSHRIFTAALESHRNAQVVAITGEQP
jgi:predicted dehydrogenase